MNTYTLVSIFSNLIGDVIARGSHGSDMDKYEKLDDVGALLYDIVEKLIRNAKNKDSVAESIKLVGERSYDILSSIYEDISEVIK